MLDRIYGGHIRQHLLNAGLKPGMKVLEMACGSGVLTQWIAEQVGPEGEVIAVDMSEEQLAVTRHSVEIVGIDNVSFIQSSIEGFEHSKDSFDIVHSSLLLLHLKEPINALKKYYDLVKQGGSVVCEEVISDTYYTYPATDMVVD